MKREIPTLRFFEDSYFHFQNSPKTKAAIFIYENESSLTLYNELGSSTYCRGNTNLVFREYIKNWKLCPLNIQIGIIEKEIGSVKDVDGDFIYSGQYIEGKYMNKKHNKETKND